MRKTVRIRRQPVYSHEDAKKTAAANRAGKGSARRGACLSPAPEPSLVRYSLNSKGDALRISILNFFQRCARSISSGVRHSWQ